MPKRSDDPEIRVGFELLNLLTSLHVLHLCSQSFGSADILGPLEDFVLLQALEQDVILRLCKLDEDDNRNWSLREFSRAQRKAGHPDRADQADALLSEYRALLRPLKLHHRNLYMVHLSKSQPQNYQPPTVRGAAKLAVQIFDLLTGETTEFSLEQPPDRAKLDLRRQLESAA